MSLAMECNNEASVDEEVEALTALYGQSNISFRRRENSTPATISISLYSHVYDTQHVNKTISLSAQIPHTYPSHARPFQPTLRAEGISAGECADMVKDMLHTQSSVPGEVCMFEYCEAIISILKLRIAANSRVESAKTDVVEIVKERQKEFEIFHGQVLTDRKSVFQAHLALISCAEDVHHVLQQLRKGSRKIDDASHNILAYRVRGSACVVQDFDDDGERGGGKCVLYVMQQFQAINVMCVVSRWFGGIKLGSIRFRHISNVVRCVLEDNCGRFSTYGEGKGVKKG